MTNEPARPSVPLDEARLLDAYAEFVRGLTEVPTDPFAFFMAGWRVRAEEAAPRSEAALVEALAAKGGAYSERNKTVVALGWMALRAGCRVGVREHVGDWDDDWRAILMIDLPTGQASWHFHDSERPMLAGLPPYPDEWDGHTTDEKYDRLAALALTDESRPGTDRRTDNN